MGGRSGKRARPRPPKADEELIPAPAWPPVRPGLSYTLGINPEAIARALLELEQEDGGYLLVEHHCPICEAATSCTGFCSAELEVFQKSLGRGVRIERSEHLLSDGDRCVFRIRPARGSRPSARQRRGRDGNPPRPTTS